MAAPAGLDWESLRQAGTAVLLVLLLWNIVDSVESVMLETINTIAEMEKARMERLSLLFEELVKRMPEPAPPLPQP